MISTANFVERESRRQHYACCLAIVNRLKNYHASRAHDPNIPYVERDASRMICNSVSPLSDTLDDRCRALANEVDE